MGAAGLSAIFSLSTRDAHGNVRTDSDGDDLAFAASQRSEGHGFDTAYDRTSGPADAHLTAAVAPFDAIAGAYSLSYFTEIAADVTGVVTLGGVGVPGASPFVAKIRHGAVDPSRVTVVGEGLDGAVRGGGVATIRILARDAFGNAIPYTSVGGGRFRIAVEPRSLVTVTQPSPAYPRVSGEGSGSGSTVTDRYADRYAAEGGYVVSNAAEFASVRIVVTLGDAVLADRRAKVVEPSGRSYSPATSVAHGDGLAPAGVAGENRTFFLTPRDEDGVALTSRDLTPPAAAFRTLVTKSGDVESSSSSFEAKVVEGSDPNDGSPFLEVTYSATGAGVYDVAVDGCEWNFTSSACDGPFRALVVRPNDFVPPVAQPVRVTIRPGPSDAAGSVATLRSTSAVVGQNVVVELRAFDANGNPRGTTTASTRATSGPSPRRCDRGATKGRKVAAAAASPSRFAPPWRPRLTARPGPPSISTSRPLRRLERVRTTSSRRSSLATR